MLVAEAVDFFRNQPRISRYMQTLMDVGLGYVRLAGRRRPCRRRGAAAGHRTGQASTGHTIYLLDEPTTGLHFDDVRRLLTVLPTGRPGQHRAQDTTSTSSRPPT